MTTGKILLIRFSSLGDVILTTAAVEALARETPGLEIHVLTKPAFRGIFEGNPRVASVVPWDPKTEGLFALAKRLSHEQYDWIADLHGSLRTRLLGLLVRGSLWTRYEKGSFARRLAVVMRNPGSLPRTHVVERYAAALGPVGVMPKRRLPKVWPGSAERATVEQLLREGGWDGRQRLLAFAPGARWATKMWPWQHWLSLLRWVREQDLGFPVLVGGPEEADFCAWFLREAEVPGVSLAGRTTVLESAAALELAAALVTNDSGTLHLANAVGTPVVALFGPTVTGFGFFPLGSRDILLERPLPCRPCSLHGGKRCPKKHHRCLVEISPSDVLGALRKIVLDSPAEGPATGGAG